MSIKILAAVHASLITFIYPNYDLVEVVFILAIDYFLVFKTEIGDFYLH